MVVPVLGRVCVVVLLVLYPLLFSVAVDDDDGVVEDVGHGMILGNAVAKNSFRYSYPRRN
jgi:hypothetical protein